MLLATDAVVLHAFDYMESSRIVRLATRDGGVISALARGARRPKSRFGGSLDLYTGGVAQLAMRPGRDLQTLTGFDATRGRHQLAASLAHFTAAAALGELALRFVGDDPNPGAFEALVQALDTLAAASPDETPRRRPSRAPGTWWPSWGSHRRSTTARSATRRWPRTSRRRSDTAPAACCARAAPPAAPPARPLPPRARDAVRGWLAGETGDGRTGRRDRGAPAAAPAVRAGAPGRRPSARRLRPLGAAALGRGMILGTAGHVDHGKTALVRALTGVDTDRLPEERRRGITIELGFAPLTLDDGRVVGVVDVPGHEAFVRTMVAGATGIDVALLVVAADEGVMPQTREHLHVLQLLAVPRAVVALTKCDLAEPDWLALVRDDVACAARRLGRSAARR